MSVTIGSPSRIAPSRMFSPLKSSNLAADGSEQTLVEYNDVGKVSGYVSLGEMQAGDEVRLRQYMLINGIFEKYADEMYSDEQDIPVIYITPKETDKGLKVTLQQITGVLRRYHNRFILEE